MASKSHKCAFGLLEEVVCYTMLNMG